MSRNLYIGLGGSGIKTIDEIKQQLVNARREDSSIATVFCTIDTDRHSLHSCTSLLSNELELVNICGELHARERYLVYRNEYDIPQNNVERLQALHNFGSGQIRSNGHFCFLCNKDKLRDMILFAYHKLTNIELNIESFNINVHLFFSLCGGTGSGIFYDVAKLVKELIPNSNIACYTYSHHYFPSSASWNNIESNTYTTFLELEACFRLGVYNPFNRCIYVDNRYTEVLPPMCYSIDEAIKQSIEKVLGSSVFIDLPYAGIVDLERLKESYEKCLNYGRYSPFSTTSFESICRNCKMEQIK